MFIIIWEHASIIWSTQVFAHICLGSRAGIIYIYIYIKYIYIYIYIYGRVLLPPSPWYVRQYPTPPRWSAGNSTSPPPCGLFGFGFWWFCGSETIIIGRYFDDLARRRDLAGSGRRRDHRKPKQIYENHYICNDIETIWPVVEIFLAPAGVETIEN